uniref:Apoptosis-inducing factor 3-like n=1 Tax=Saccoglossus kowalevskii TaxID=10224 RepID=A0ABM0MM79_SACKO|nr:PREDICTED: apoptosis-inducing factor 3-like [Saccoglossus kowalevskii]
MRSVVVQRLCSVFSCPVQSISVVHLRRFAETSPLRSASCQLIVTLERSVKKIQICSSRFRSFLPIGSGRYSQLKTLPLFSRLISTRMGHCTSKEDKHGVAPLPKAQKVVPVEAVVCKVDDLKDGEMREVSVGSGKALLIKEHGAYSAIGSKCTHYGAPLVEIKNDNVVVKTNKKALEKNRRIKSMSTRLPEEDKTFLLIGGGAASEVCAETLRQEGFKGRVVIATKEKYLPYDRPKLSKALSSTAASIALRDKDFYSVYDIEVSTDMEAVAVDTMMNSVKFKNGESINYDQLLLATGGTPRVLPIPGHDLKNVCLLRTPDDANFIADHAKGKKVVIVGTSFIGMEVAASLTDKTSYISAVGLENVPFELAIGEQMLEEKNVTFYMNNSVKEFHGENGQLKSVELKSGENLPADLCVVGAGVIPSTDFIKDSGLTMNTRNQLVVNKYMRTNKPNVYAAGDIVEFPLTMANDEKVNIQHWQIAHMHGRTAALNMLDHDIETHSVPYFWTMMLGKSLRFTGYNVGHDDVIIDGSTEELKFVAYYTKGENVVAVASIGADPTVSQAAELFSAGKEITKTELQ